MKNFSQAGARVPPLSGDFIVFADAFAAAAEQFGDREAYVDPDGRVTFSDWHARSNALAHLLSSAGAGQGDVIAILLPSSIDFAVAYGAVQLIGGVATAVNTRLGPADASAVLEQATPAVIIAEDAMPAGATATQVITRAEIAALGSGQAHFTPDTPICATDAALIIWSSGTTGRPKGAWFDHSGLAGAVHAAGVMSAPFDRRLVATPFAHAGYMAKVWEQLAWGITFVIPPTPWSAIDTVRVLTEERITVTGAVPTQWAKLLEQPLPEAARPFPELRLGISATAPAPPELVEAVRERLGIPLVVRYAMTESPSISGTDPDDSPEVQFRTVGRAQSGMEVRIVDDNGDDVPPGTTGHVLARGTCRMRGYWRDPELTAKVIDGEGWLHTSDIGSLDTDGVLTLNGRSTDMYIRGGYNVYPLEVEQVLAAHPAISSVAIVGAPAPVIGEIGVAFIVITEGTLAPDRTELRKWVRQRLADYKAPDSVVILDSLPLTPMLKVDRAELRHRAVALPPRATAHSAATPRP